MRPWDIACTAPNTFLCVWPSVRQSCVCWMLRAADMWRAHGPASRNALMLVAIAVAVRPNGLVGHVARAAFDAVVNAHLAHRTKRFVIKCRHSQSGAQLLIE